jgi:hypothetical protein
MSNLIFLEIHENISLELNGGEKEKNNGESTGQVQRQGSRAHSLREIRMACELSFPLL